MSGRHVFHFEIIRRGRRAWPALRTIRRSSNQFKIAVSTGDQAKMEATSQRAWDSLTNLFEVLRNEQDHGYLADVHMAVPVGLLVSSATAQERGDMIAARRLDRNHPTCGDLSLRDALNKVAHYDGSKSTYRIDRRGAHYLVLSGRLGNSNWVAEFLVSKLCAAGAKATRAITLTPNTP